MKSWKSCEGMELGCLKNGIGFTTMLSITTWEIPIKTLMMHAQFLEDLRSIHILVGVELADHPPNQVLIT